MKPEVSVVMPVYNGERFLRAAVESILEQTFDNFEFIIVDDGSTDSSADIIRSFGDNRIRLIRQTNQGISKALNRGIKESRGNFIARMDDDDVSLPARLERQKAFLDQHPNCGIVGTWAIHITEEDEELYVSKMPQCDSDARQLLVRQSPFYHGSVMFRRSLFDQVGSYPEDLAIFYEDWVLFRRFAEKAEIANIGEVLYKFRLRSSAVNNRSQKQARKIREIVERFVSTGVLTEDDEKTLKSLKTGLGTQKRKSNYYLRIGVTFIEKREDYARARKMIWKSLVINPLCLRAWVNFVYCFLTPELVARCKMYSNKIRGIES